jgi:molybdopterin molybdotransferase
MTEPDVSNLITLSKAMEIIDAADVSPSVVERPLADCQGLRLAEEVLADRDYPPFDKSLMDGYAVRSADVARTPVDLTIVGEIAAGWPADHALGPAQAMAIMTGAAMPGGADGVIPVEDTEAGAFASSSGVGGTVRIIRAEKPARYVGRQGSDVGRGAVVLPKGTAIGPAQIAVAASVGARKRKVIDRPAVAVLGTGDELVSVDDPAGPTQIRNSNNPMLVGLLKNLGCNVRDLGCVADDPDLIRRAISDGLAAGVLFITGGVSMGKFDHVPHILAELGFDLKITKLRIKPGKPFVFGTMQRDGKSHYVFGLPGNPVSAYVCTLRLASRLLTRLAGGTPMQSLPIAQVDSPLPANGPREFYQPAVLQVLASGASVHPLQWKGSADVFTLARANALIVRPENAPAAMAGESVPILEMS